VAVDEKEALKWYRLAVELGYADAQDHVNRLEAELAATNTT
jgi:TPR repeat protein